MKNLILLLFLFIAISGQTQCDLDIQVVVLNGPTAQGSCDAEIQPFIQGGTAPYAIFYYDCADSVYTGITIPVGSPYSNICAGNHSFVVTDALGCTDTADCVNIPDVSSDSCHLTINYTNTLCHNQCMGFAQAVASGHAPISYHWSNGSTAVILTDLCAGDYFVSIQDNSGCMLSQLFTISQPTQIQTDFFAVSSPSYPGACDATMSYQISGGTPAYVLMVLDCQDSSVHSYSSLTSYCSGEYALIVEDSYGCRDTSDCALINDPVSGISDDSNAIDFFVDGRTVVFSEHIEQICVRDLQGRILFEDDQIIYSYCLPGQIVPGLYIMFFRSKKGEEFSKKIIVQ